MKSFVPIFLTSFIVILEVNIGIDAASLSTPQPSDDDPADAERADKMLKALPPRTVKSALRELLGAVEPKPKPVRQEDTVCAQVLELLKKIVSDRSHSQSAKNPGRTPKKNKGLWEKKIPKDLLKKQLPAEGTNTNPPRKGTVHKSEYPAGEQIHESGNDSYEDRTSGELVLGKGFASLKSGHGTGNIPRPLPAEQSNPNLPKKLTLQKSKKSAGDHIHESENDSYEDRPSGELVLGEGFASLKSGHGTRNIPRPFLAEQSYPNLSSKRGLYKSKNRLGERESGNNSYEDRSSGELVLGDGFAGLKSVRHGTRNIPSHHPEAHYSYRKAQPKMANRMNSGSMQSDGIHKHIPAPKTTQNDDVNNEPSKNAEALNSMNNAGKNHSINNAEKIHSRGQARESRQIPYIALPAGKYIKARPMLFEKRSKQEVESPGKKYYLDPIYHNLNIEKPKEDQPEGQEATGPNDDDSFIPDYLKPAYNLLEIPQNDPGSVKERIKKQSHTEQERIKKQSHTEQKNAMNLKMKYQAPAEMINNKPEHRRRLTKTGKVTEDNTEFKINVNSGKNDRKPGEKLVHVNLNVDLAFTMAK